MSTPPDAADWARLFRVVLNHSTSKLAAPDHPGLDVRGGTAMMLRIGNRVSHDVDIFLPDPQFLSFLDPEKRDFEFEMRPDDFRGNRSLKPFPGWKN